MIAKKRDQTDLTAEHLVAGIKLVVDNLDQTYIDVPFAATLVSAMARNCAHECHGGSAEDALSTSL